MNQPPLQTVSSLAPLARAAATAMAGTAADTMKMLGLLSLLGLVVSAALLPHVAPNDLGWVFSHLE